MTSSTWETLQECLVQQREEIEILQSCLDNHNDIEILFDGTTECLEYIEKQLLNKLTQINTKSTK